MIMITIIAFIKLVEIGGEEQKKHPPLTFTKGIFKRVDTIKKKGKIRKSNDLICCLVIITPMGQYLNISWVCGLFHFYL